MIQTRQAALPKAWENQKNQKNPKKPIFSRSWGQPPCSPDLLNIVFFVFFWFFLFSGPWAGQLAQASPELLNIGFLGSLGPCGKMWYIHISIYVYMSIYSNMVWPCLFSNV